MFEKAKAFFRNLYIKIVLPFRQNLGDPRYLAMSTAVGVFCALVPMVGQTYICFLVWLFLRKFQSTKFSFAIGAAWTFVTNPVTTPFVFYAYYVLGEWILGGAPFAFSAFLEKAKSIFENDPNFSSLLKNGFVFAVDEVGVPLLLGGTVVMAVLTPLSYVLSYRIALYFKRRHEAAEAKKV